MKKIQLDMCKQALTELNGVEPEIWFTAKNKSIKTISGIKPYGFIVNVIGDSLQLVPIAVDKNAYSFLLNDVLVAEAEKRYFINRLGCYELHCKVNGKIRKIEISKKLNQPNINIIKEYISRTAGENFKMKAIYRVTAVLVCAALISCSYFGLGEFYKIRTSYMIKYTESKNDVNLHCMLKDYDKYGSSFKGQANKYSNGTISYELPDFLSLTDSEYSLIYKSEDSKVTVTVSNADNSSSEFIFDDENEEKHFERCEKYFGIRPDNMFDIQRMIYSFDIDNYKAESTSEAIAYYSVILMRNISCNDLTKNVYLFEKDNIRAIIKQGNTQNATIYTLDIYNVSDLNSHENITVLIKTDADIDVENIYAVINSISFEK